jgi:alanyl-tRNA synthetase
MTSLAPTALLYHRDPLLLSFDAKVVGHAQHLGKDSVVLDETAFYPEAGGQLADRGALAGLLVLDVQVDDVGVVHHFVDGARPAVGTSVSGAVDAARRRQHMAQHTAQHMLSKALIDAASAETVSARLGETSCTIDADVPVLSDKQLARAEEAVNRVVDEDRGVRAFFPTPQELDALPLRRKPKVSENIRVVEVAGYDWSPCGGTHCTHTSQIGVVRVTGVEKYKGMMRVFFQAGPRARDDVFARARTLEEIARGASTAPDEVPAMIEKLRAELKGAREERGRLQSIVAQAVAKDLARDASGAPRTRVVDVIDGDADLLRSVALAVSAAGADALLACNTSDGVHVLCIRGAAGSTLDCGAIVKKAAQETGGRGGGKPERAEGRLPAGTDWRALVARL